MIGPQWIVAGVFVFVGLLAGTLVFLGKRDPKTRRYVPPIYGRAGNFNRKEGRE